MRLRVSNSTVLADREARTHLFRDETSEFLTERDVLGERTVQHLIESLH